MTATMLLVPSLYLKEKKNNTHAKTKEHQQLGQFQK